MFVSVLLSGPSSYTVFVVLALITLTSYVLSRSRYFRFGSYLLSYAFTSIGYATIYLGTANSIESAITSTVHIALIFSSAILSPGAYLVLAILSSIATFTSPLYSNLPVAANENYLRTGGIVVVINAMLYGISVLRAQLDTVRDREVEKAHQHMEEAKSDLAAINEKHAVELENANQQVQSRVNRLHSIAEISQTISDNAGRELAELLTVVASTTSDKLGFYHVGIFLLDENRQYAVLRAANTKSKGGLQMLARHHQLKVGGTGIVGYVSQSGQPRIALDTGADAVFFNNPDLPNTRSEMALPLKVGTQVVGVLDVQSTLSSAFSEEDLTTFSTLANQLATVILAMQEGESGKSTSRTANRQKVAFSHDDNQTGFSYLPDGTISSPLSLQGSSVEKAVISGDVVVQDASTKSNISVLSVPVKVRDEVIGLIHIESTDTGRKWTDDEVAMVQSVSERAALALENARLFEETARRARQERVVAEVTSRIGESSDFERILHTTIETLGRTLGATRTFIQLETPSSDQENKSEMGADE
jgi:GAF domain-containing protein